MIFNHDGAHPLAELLTDDRSGYLPPRAVFQAIYTLIGDEDPLQVLSDYDHGGPKRWTCLVLTSNYLVRAIATRPGERDLHLKENSWHPPEETTLEASAWPRSDIARTDVRSIESDRSGADWDWLPVVTCQLRDGDEVVIPPHGEAYSRRRDPKVAAFLDELRKGWRMP